MPHPDREHSLQIQLATALRERDEQKARADAAEGALTRLRSDYAAAIGFGNGSPQALAAARRECDHMREVLRDVLAHAEWMDSHHGRFPNSAVLNARAVLVAPVDGEKHQFLPPYRAHHLATVRIHTDKCAAGEYDPDCLPPRECR